MSWSADHAPPVLQLAGTPPLIVSKPPFLSCSAPSRTVAWAVRPPPMSWAVAGAAAPKATNIEPTIAAIHRCMRTPCAEKFLQGTVKPFAVVGGEGKGRARPVGGPICLTHKALTFLRSATGDGTVTLGRSGAIDNVTVRSDVTPTLQPSTASAERAFEMDAEIARWRRQSTWHPPCAVRRRDELPDDRRRRQVLGPLRRIASARHRRAPVRVGTDRARGLRPRARLPARR